MVVKLLLPSEVLGFDCFGFVIVRNEGLLQHSCKQLLDFVFQRSTVHTRYVVKFSVAAIYDEQSVDLLGYSFFTFLNSSTKATSKGIFSGGRIPHFSVITISFLYSRKQNCLPILTFYLF